jgi:hypothetical protein
MRFFEALAMYCRHKHLIASPELNLARATKQSDHERNRLAWG